MRAVRFVALAALLPAALCAAPAVQLASASAQDGQRADTGKTATPASAQKPGEKDAAPKPVAMDPKVKLRALVTMVVSVERAHRERVAKLERLIDVIQAKGTPGPLNTAFDLRYGEQETYEASMAGFARELGPEIYARLRAQMDAGAGKPPPLRPRPPPPPPPPYVPPTPEQVEQQIRDEEAKRGEETGQTPEEGREKP